MAAALPIEHVVSVAYRAGFRGAALETAVAVAGAESTFNPGAISATGDYGLWQINHAAHPSYDTAKLLDPFYNAQAAWKISSAGTNWRPWVAYKSGAYRRHLAAAREAIAATAGVGAEPGPPAMPPTGGIQLGPVNLPNPAEALLNLPSPADAIGGVAGAVLGALGNLPGVKEVAAFFSAIADPAAWRRLGLILAGAVLAVAGAVLVTRDVSLPAIAGAVGGPQAAAAVASVS